MDFMCSTVILKTVCPIPISVTMTYAVQNQSIDMPKFLICSSFYTISPS